MNMQFFHFEQKSIFN